MILLLVKHEIKPGIIQVEMKGSIHSGTDCRRLEQEVEGLIKTGSLRVIFDLAQVTHIDSAAIGSMVKCFSQLKKAGGVLRISGATGMLEGSFKLTKVDRVISLFPNAAAAAEDFPLPGAPA